MAVKGGKWVFVLHVCPSCMSEELKDTKVATCTDWPLNDLVQGATKDACGNGRGGRAEAAYPGSLWEESNRPQVWLLNQSRKRP